MPEMYGKGKPWKTKAAFYAWLRGGLRRSLWMRHPVKIEFLKSNRHKAPLGRNGKDVWCMQCAICSNLFRQSDCEVDHIHPAGKLNGVEDISSFVERLAFVSEEDLRICCKLCHSILTYSERYGCTFEEAKLRKIEIAKKKEAALKRKREKKK